MSDEKKRRAKKEQAARDRVYGFLGAKGSMVMHYINANSTEESLKVLKKHPELTFLIKIMCITTVQEIWDLCGDGKGPSPVGSWEKIDAQRQGVSQDPRAMVAQLVTDAWSEFDGDPADCRIWVSNTAEELEQQKEAEPKHGLRLWAMLELLDPAMEMLLQVHELFGPEKEDLLPRLEEIVQAYGPHDELDTPDEDGYRQAINGLADGMRELMKNNERRASQND